MLFDHNDGEVFGINFIKQNDNKAKDGSAALADLDTNKDGVFDNKDNKFNKIKVWQDKNQDGLSQTSELKTLAQHNIKSINLHAKQKSKDWAVNECPSGFMVYIRVHHPTGRCPCELSAGLFLTKLSATMP